MFNNFYFLINLLFHLCLTLFFFSFASNFIWLGSSGKGGRIFSTSSKKPMHLRSDSIVPKPILCAMPFSNWLMVKILTPACSATSLCVRLRNRRYSLNRTPSSEMISAFDLASIPYSVNHVANIVISLFIAEYGDKYLNIFSKCAHRFGLSGVRHIVHYRFSMTYLDSSASAASLNPRR